MNTQNTQFEKVYLVSFGNSRKYVLRDRASGKDSNLTKVEAELNDFLREKFPDETFAYYTSPRVDEISRHSEDKYSGYPALDAEAVDQIKEVLVKEVENMEANRRMSSNAPYASVNPAAVDITNII